MEVWHFPLVKHLRTLSMPSYSKRSRISAVALTVKVSINTRSSGTSWMPYRERKREQPQFSQNLLPKSLDKKHRRSTRACKKSAYTSEHYREEVAKGLWSRCPLLAQHTLFPKKDDIYCLHLQSLAWLRAMSRRRATKVLVFPLPAPARMMTGLLQSAHAASRCCWLSWRAGFSCCRRRTVSSIASSSSSWESWESWLKGLQKRKDRELALTKPEVMA